MLTCLRSLIGQAGHMGDASVAGIIYLASYRPSNLANLFLRFIIGFDPIFFLHHANVDRLLALWSALNPEVWVTEGPARGGTWTIPDTDTVNAKTGSFATLLVIYNSQPT